MASLSVRPGSAGLIGAIVCGAVAVVVLWFQNTTFQLHAATDYAIAAGRLSGLLAGYAAIVLIALMARIPPLERGVGAD
ncbi:MAG: ferric reductase, partial [Jatrophihabitantaceae bacterium]